MESTVNQLNFVLAEIRRQYGPVHIEKVEEFVSGFYSKNPSADPAYVAGLILDIAFAADSHRYLDIMGAPVSPYDAPKVPF